MTLSVAISPQAGRRLEDKAKAAGLDLATFVSRLLEVEAHRRTVVEMSGQIFENFKRMNMTEEELGERLEEEKHAARAARRGAHFAE